MRLFSDAFHAGDAATAYRLLSARCQRSVTPAQLAAQAAALPGFNAVKTLDLQVSGDAARVTTRYAEPRLDRVDEAWVREAGQWRRDAC